MELINKLGQYELMSVCATWSSKYIGNCSVALGLPLACCAIYVAVETNIPWQLETLILRSEWAHAFIWPHSPGACDKSNKNMHLLLTSLPYLQLDFNATIYFKIKQFALNPNT